MCSLQQPQRRWNGIPRGAGQSLSRCTQRLRVCAGAQSPGPLLQLSPRMSMAMAGSTAQGSLRRRRRARALREESRPQASACRLATGIIGVRVAAGREPLAFLLPMSMPIRSMPALSGAPPVSLSTSTTGPATAPLVVLARRLWEQRSIRTLTRLPQVERGRLSEARRYTTTFVVALAAPASILLQRPLGARFVPVNRAPASHYDDDGDDCCARQWGGECSSGVVAL